MKSFIVLIANISHSTTYHYCFNMNLCLFFLLYCCSIQLFHSFNDHIHPSLIYSILYHFSCSVTGFSAILKFAIKLDFTLNI